DAVEQVAGADRPMPRPPIQSSQQRLPARIEVIPRPVKVFAFVGEWQEGVQILLHQRVEADGGDDAVGERRIRGRVLWSRAERRKIPGTLRQAQGRRCGGMALADSPAFGVKEQNELFLLPQGTADLSAA